MEITIEQRFRKVQVEQKEWSLRNFGKQSNTHTALGLIEELGEFAVAWYDAKHEEVVDAIGDVAVYMSSYCNIAGWDMANMYSRRSAVNKAAVDLPQRVSQLIRDIAHHQLKGDQNIRGGTALHQEKMQETLQHAMYQMDVLANSIIPGGSFLTVLEAVWEKVSKRDWVKNPNDAHKVAAPEDCDGSP